MDKLLATSLNSASKADFDKLLRQLKADHAEVSFVEGVAFCWSPDERQITYKANAQGLAALFSLLHEVGHARLKHRRYTLDFELLAIEVAAWEQAKQICDRYDINIDEDHVQNCLDTYRDWLYGRSICPSCTTKSLQLDDKPAYSCFNCHATWQVAPSRFCRPYRKVKGNERTVTFADSR